MCLLQIIPVARCYPPQPEDGKYPGCEFDDALEESGSATPTTSRASTRHANVDWVEDSEELDAHSPSLGDDGGAVIPAKPLNVRPPPRVGKRTLPNFSFESS
jgi:hypothetical protein